ncbi:MAG: hypothetical protein Q8879_02790 [Candidatus Phytoplasma australasiaticum]|nr:hypothetical protein [Pigeon pea little leaf phytoplasma]MDV3197971.1 hypothetical protein [Candidatus Phytoplasma australasiaticum]
MESGVLGNLLAPFGRGLLVIFDRKINPIKETPIIYSYIIRIVKFCNRWYRRLNNNLKHLILNKI